MSVIEIDRLKKVYGNAAAIEDVSFSVEQGEIFGFVGPNGAGKSTTIKLLLNLIYPTDGTAAIMGKHIVSESEQIKRFTAYVPSEVRLYPHLTVRELLRTTMSFYKADASVELERLCAFFEIETRKKIGQLSLGNKKKASIVSALLSNPTVLILDEPTNGLDPFMQKRLFQELEQRTKQGATVLLSSHNLTEIQDHCTRAAFIKSGRIVAVEDVRTSSRPVKIVTAWSDHGFDPLLSLDMNVIERTETKIVFSYSGDMQLLANTMAQARLSDFTVEPMSMEEQFLHVYKGGEQ